MKKLGSYDTYIKRYSPKLGNPIKALKILFFPILEFCFHEATLEAYLVHSGCSSDMVDSALKNGAWAFQT